MCRKANRDSAQTPLDSLSFSAPNREGCLIKKDWRLLFYEADLDAILRHQASLVKDRVAAIAQEDFGTTSDEFLAAKVASGLVVKALVLHEDRISVSTKDVKIDVSHDFSRGGWGDEPVYARGVEVTYTLPFSGDSQLFKCRPNQFNFNPPRAVVFQGYLEFPIDQPDGDVKATKEDFTEEIKRIKEYLGWQQVQIDSFNSSIEQSVRGEVKARRAVLDQRKADLESLGYSTKGDAPSIPTTAADSAAARKTSRSKGKRTYDVALSFAGEDRDYVENVATELDRFGISVFYDRFEQVTLWGSDLATHLGDVYSKDSRFVVMFLSTHYASKAWPDHEKSFALGRHLKGDTGRILPVRFDDTEISGLPPTLGYLDLRVLTPGKLAELIRQKIELPEADP